MKSRYWKMAIAILLTAFVFFCVIKLIYEREHTATVEPITLTEYVNGDPFQQTEFSTALSINLSMHRQLFNRNSTELALLMRFTQTPPLPDSLVTQRIEIEKLLTQDGFLLEMSSTSTAPLVDEFWHASKWLGSLRTELILDSPGKVTLSFAQHGETIFTIDFTCDLSPLQQALTELYH